MQIKITKRSLSPIKKFNTEYLLIFEEYINPSNKMGDINSMFGYSRKSQAIVRHSQKVMDKLLFLESISKSQNFEKMISPREYSKWWKSLFDKHKEALENLAE